MVQLKKEIQFLESYFYILQLRFVDSLELKISIHHPEIESLKVVPLTLQLLVENAIKHNSFSRDIPLCIDIQIEDNGIHVSNKKQIKINKEDSTQKGLEYIKALYSLQNESISIVNSEHEFTVKIPHIKNDNI